MKLTQPHTKEEAREQAIMWQYMASGRCPKYGAEVLPDEQDNCSLCGLHSASLSYSDLAEASTHFTATGKRFELLAEFKENGII